jgi:hypothetical protein
MPAEIVMDDKRAIERAATPTAMDLLDRLSRSVTDPQAAVEIAKQIVDLQVRQEELRQNQERFEWEKYDRDARVAFAKAFESFKADVPKIVKGKRVFYKGKDGKPDTEYYHVELDKACDVLIPALLKVGITHRWKSADLPGGLTRVTCFLRHRLGYEEEGSSLAGAADQSGGKNPIQGVGSSTSYLERYTLLATCGIVPSRKDNDGQEEQSAEGMDEKVLDEYVEALNHAPDLNSLKSLFSECWNKAKALGDSAAKKAFQTAYEAQKRKLA